MKNELIEHFSWNDRLTDDESEEIRKRLSKMNKMFVTEIFNTLQRKCVKENGDNMWNIEKLELVKWVLIFK